MQLIVQGRNLDVNDWTRDYVEKKLGKLERFLSDIGEVRAELSQHNTRAEEDRYRAQITLWSEGQLIRAEEATSDLFASVDASIDKILRQVKRFKGRKGKAKRREAAQITEEANLAAIAQVVEEIETAEESTGQIVRRKSFDVIPMDEEEAIEQMELLGHNFYIFYNSDLNAVNVLYRRNDDNYGLLQPSFM